MRLSRMLTHGHLSTGCGGAREGGRRRSEAVPSGCARRCQHGRRDPRPRQPQPGGRVKRAGPGARASAWAGWRQAVGGAVPGRGRGRARALAGPAPGCGRGSPPAGCWLAAAAAERGRSWAARGSPGRLPPPPRSRARPRRGRHGGQRGLGSVCCPRCPSPWDPPGAAGGVGREGGGEGGPVYPPPPPPARPSGAGGPVRVRGGGGRRGRWLSSF